MQMVKSRRKVTLKTRINNVEVNWNTDYKSETYKTYTIKMIAKNEWVSYGRF